MRQYEVAKARERRVEGARVPGERGIVDPEGMLGAAEQHVLYGGEQHVGGRLVGGGLSRDLEQL
jgi:hypothetical protein